MTLTPGKVVLSNPLTCTNTAKGDNKLYSDAKGVVPSLDLRFAEGKNLNDYMTGQNLITFSRPVGANQSPGTYVDENKIIQLSSADQPRFDHDPTTGESLGLLVEESRENLLRYSEAFNQTEMFHVQVSQLHAGDGKEKKTPETAYFMVEEEDWNIHVLQEQSGWSVGNNVTLSVFAKASTRNHAVLGIWGSGGRRANA